MAGIKEWWGGQSTTSKVLWVGGTIVTVGLILYFTLGNKSESKKDDKSQDIPEDKSSGGSTTTTTTTTTTKSEEKGTGTSTTPTVDKSTLPNGGKGCGVVKTTFDKDFDYVKCDGVWYTKSKPNAVSAYAKGLYKDWKSLAANKVATDRLNNRYPNG